MKIIYAAIISGVVLLAGCEKYKAPKHSGPMKIVSANFDYHQSLERPDGQVIEFSHAGWVDALSNVGDVVDITYRGDGKSSETIVDSVKIVRRGPEYIKQHPELRPNQKGHWVSVKDETYPFDQKYFIDADGQMCGEVRKSRYDHDFTAYATGDRARHSIYIQYLDSEKAKDAVYAECR
jgi:hypothetical protein